MSSSAGRQRDESAASSVGADGQASVELVLVLPLVVLLFLALLQAGILLRDQLLVVQAAREGAREAAVSPERMRIEAAVRRAAPGLDRGLEVRVDRGPRVGDLATVAVSALPARVPTGRQGTGRASPGSLGHDAYRADQTVRIRGPRIGGEGGSAALAIPVATVLVVATVLGLTDLGAFMVARARAQTAADAAALAAAVEIALRTPGSNGASNPGSPTEQARRLAEANGARLIACRCPGNGSGPGPTASETQAPAPSGPERRTSRTLVVRVDVPVHTRLLPGRNRIPAEARADARVRGQ